MIVEGFVPDIAGVPSLIFPMEISADIATEFVPSLTVMVAE